MAHSNFKYLPTITGIFTATLLISNTLDNKIFQFYNISLPAGIILFPLAYLFGDVLTEIYGFGASRKVIWTGFFGLVLMTICFIIAGKLPAAPFWTFQKDFDNILGRVPRIVAASITAYLAGEFVNSFTVSKVKVRMQGKNMGVRFVLSTIFGQAVDTSVFVLIAFVGVFPVSELLTITLSGWAFKVAWEIIALPFTIYVVKWLKALEGVDIYDRNISYRIV